MFNGGRIHLLNIALMIISLGLAICIPFKLFLFAYAVLGPLHYLTEINWLHQKKYYINNPSNVWILIALAFIIFIPGVINRLTFFFDLNQSDVLRLMARYLSKFYGSFLFAGLIIAAVLVYYKYNRVVLGIFIIGLTSLVLFRYMEWYYLLTAILLPTLIHVYLFTLFFIMYGVIKSKSIYGLAEVLMLLLVPFLIYYIPLQNVYHSFNDSSLNKYVQTGFAKVNLAIGKLTGGGDRGHAFFTTTTGVRIQVFIAFAYMYHYLNWFSKVSLIGWLKHTSIFKTITIIVLWLIAIGIYWYDFKTGLSALFFLSLLHVILEFPLNIICIREVYSFVYSKFSRVR
jgi:hypothetical protein